MSDLLRFYRKWLASLAGAAIALAVLDAKLVAHLLTGYFGSETWIVPLSTAVTSKTTLVLALVIGEIVVRKWLWMVMHPELNFKGEWEGETEYTTVELGNPPVKPLPAKHKIKFNQDCLTFEMSPTRSLEFRRWGALAITLVDKISIRYAYWVKYGKSDSFPPEAMGYEELTVTKSNWFGRPLELSGSFYHCVTGVQPLYSGAVVFTRRAPGVMRAWKIFWLWARRLKLPVPSSPS
jgi:hypothetical protein